MTIKVEITSANYAQVKRDFDLLQATHQKLFSSGLIALGGFKAIEQILNSKIISIKKALKALDPKSTSHDDILIPIKEEDLWKNRTKAYDYLM